MADENMSDELRQFFQKQREREQTIARAVVDLKALQSYNDDVGKPDIDLSETITRAELEDQKLDRALAKRGF